MILSGTAIGFICVLALLFASLLIAFLDEKQRDKIAGRSRFLSRLALGLFLAAFAGGVVVTLLGGIRDRGDRTPMTEMKEFTETAGDLSDLAAQEKLAHQYLEQQDYEKVFQISHEVLQKIPKSAESRTHMAMVLFQMGDLEGSLAQFKLALESDPESLEALAFKGLVELQGKKDLVAAKKTWDKYLTKAKPGDVGWGMIQMLSSNLAP